MSATKKFSTFFFFGLCLASKYEMICHSNQQLSLFSSISLERANDGKAQNPIHLSIRLDTERVKKQSFLSGLLNCHHFMLCQGFDSTRLDSTLLDYLTAINSLSEHWVITRGAGQFNFLLWIRDKMLKSAHFQRSFFLPPLPSFFLYAF